MDNEKSNITETEKILRGLEFCINNDCTSDCPYSDVDFCSAVLQKDTLALISKINCQNESLQKEKEQLLNRVNYQKHALYESQAYIAELQAEITELTEKTRISVSKSYPVARSQVCLVWLRFATRKITSLVKSRTRR